MPNHRLKQLGIDTSWTLFLDRDGVINQRLPGAYVKQPEQFHFIKGVPEAVAILTGFFGRILIVTNQQGIGKGLMTEDALSHIHEHMLRVIRHYKGEINAIYHAPDLEGMPGGLRKPGPGMAHLAKRDFPELDFNKSIMVGDTLSDMLFGKNLGMLTILVGGRADETVISHADMRFDDLLGFALAIKNSDILN